MYRTVTATAENTFSEAMPVHQGYGNISVYGTFTATVTLQRSYDNGRTWGDVNTYTGPAEEIFLEAEAQGAQYRIGVKAGGFTSGSVTARIGQ